MTGPDRIEWRRGFPGRAWRLVASCVAAGAVAVGVSWLLFGNEPETLSDGASNPLAAIPQWTLLAALAVVLAASCPLLRRPTVTATHYALSVRPGMVRTVLLPWAAIAEIMGVRTADGDYLLIQLRPEMDAVGDRPGYWDRSVLRGATRAYPRAVDYDLAVRLGEFAGRPDRKLATLAAYAPETVHIVNRL
jgi:hypothetical protein